MKMSKRYGRRAFLGGATVALGLPFLEALAPRRAIGQVGAAPKRFLGYFYPNGMWMPDWRPVGTGANFQFGPAMGPTGRVFTDGFAAYPMGEHGVGLDAVRDSILIISGLQNTKQQPGPGDHSGGVGSFLTNRTVPRQADATSMGGPSIDYTISKTIGQTTKRPYLAMSGEVARPSGVLCDSGFSCSVGDHITFDDMGKNLPRFDNPGQVFDQLFMGFSPGASNEAAKKRWALDRSILDTVMSEAQSLQPKLSYQDKPRFEEYVTSVREVERRIQNLQTVGPAMCSVPTRATTGFVFENGRQTIDICHELMALAFQCDATRVISFMWGNSSNGRPHNFISCPGGHHDISHHGTNTTSINKLKRIDYWWFRRFASLLVRLKGMKDVDGRSVLDNTLVFQGTDVSDGDKHNHDDMPVVIAGGAAGFRLGQHVQLAPGAAGAPHFGDLFITIAKAFGVNLTTFGEMGKAPLTGLT
jgi:hypothetical protein